MNTAPMFGHFSTLCMKELSHQIAECSNWFNHGNNQKGWLTWKENCPLKEFQKLKIGNGNRVIKY